MSIKEPDQNQAYMPGPGEIIAALVDALDRTERNFEYAVQGFPVRDMCETLAENRAARRKAATWVEIPEDRL